MGNKGLRYAFRDGFISLYRHPVILVASVTTMYLMLVLLGAFVLFSMNAKSLVQQVGNQPPLEIQFKVGASEESVRHLDQQLSENEHIMEHQVMSPEENLEVFKKKVAKPELFDEFDYTQHLPWTILVRLSDPALSESFKNEVMNYPDVFDVMMQSNLIEVLNNAIRNVNFAISIIFPILCLISILIISNMIRMIALSRSNELSIMKAMGATEHYIRIPFVIEGLFVALLASILSLLTLFFLYRKILDRFQGSLGELKILEMLEIGGPLVLVVAGIGFLVAGLTSALAVKRYIKS